MPWQVHEISPRQYQLCLKNETSPITSQRLATTCRLLSQHGLVINRIEACQQPQRMASQTQQHQPIVPLTVWVNTPHTPYTCADIEALLAETLSP